MSGYVYPPMIRLLLGYSFRVSLALLITPWSVREGRARSWSKLSGRRGPLNYRTRVGRQLPFQAN